jgi:hypothetical protein
MLPNPAARRLGGSDPGACAFHFQQDGVTIVESTLEHFPITRRLFESREGWSSLNEKAT